MQMLITCFAAIQSRVYFQHVLEFAITMPHAFLLVHATMLITTLNARVWMAAPTDALVKSILMNINVQV